MSNVAAGQAATDAVNVGQLRLAVANVSGAGPLNVRYAAGPNGQPTNVLPLIGDGSGAPVQITNVAAGRADTDAANFGQVKNAVAYDTDGSGRRSGTITLAGPAGQAVRIANVAPGIAGSDAMNVGQLRQAQAEAQTDTDTQVDRARSDARSYMDSEVGALRDSTGAALNMLIGQIRAVRTEARSGVAAAMAMGAAPMPAEASQPTLALQSATFREEFAMGGSMAYRLDTNLPVALTAGASGSRGNMGLRASVLIVFK